MKKLANKNGAAARRNKGFTLMEMLVVIAIIAILVTILVPNIGTSLRKAKEAADVANIRAAYAQYQIAFVEGNSGLSLYVDYTDHTNESIVVAEGGIEVFRAKLNYPDATNIIDNAVGIQPATELEIRYQPQVINGGNLYVWKLAK